MMDSPVTYKNYFGVRRMFFANKLLMRQERQSANRFTSVEAVIDAAARRALAALPQTGLWPSLIEFLVFGLKQAWACLFGGLFLGIVLLTKLLWPDQLPLARYDFLFLAAVAIQLGMLAFKLEKPSEAVVILLFHIVGTAMELFKTSHGSWAYPDPAFLKLGAVPLFSGFMYAAVGSYIARVTRIFDFEYSNYPATWKTMLLAAAIYINFFAHHYVWDARWLLFAATALMFFRTSVHYRVFRHRHRMNLLLGFALVALFIWLAENLATWSKVWIYPNQANGWALVSVGKYGSWYLLMIISFVLVNLVHKPKQFSRSAASPQPSASSS